MNSMDSALVFAVIITTLVCLELITIFLCSSYVYWIESNCKGERGYQYCGTKRSNSKKCNTLDIVAAPNPAMPPTNPSNHKSYKTKINTLQSRSVLLLSTHSFFALLGCLGALAVHIVGLSHTRFTDALWCEKVVPKYYSICYVLSNVSLYMFLNARSELVKTAADSSKNFQRLRQFTKLLATCSPGVAIINIFLWGGRVVEVDGIRYCVDAPSWENGVFFLVLSIFVSILFLILFIWPLRAHILQIKEIRSESSHTILAVVKRNFILSAIATTSTSIALTFFVVTTLAYHEHPPIFVYGLGIGAIDLCINNLCISLMSSAWIPKKLKGFRFCRMDARHQNHPTGVITPILSDENVLTQIKKATHASIDEFVKTNASEPQSGKEQ